MYNITEQKFGFLVTFSGMLDTGELNEWYDESEKKLSQRKVVPFGVIVDMRNMSPIAVETREVLKKGQRLYHEKGMQRSSVVISNAIALMQIKQVSKESGIYQWERYFDAEVQTDWPQKALLWVRNGVSSA